MDGKDSKGSNEGRPLATVDFKQHHPARHTFQFLASATLLHADPRLTRGETVETQSFMINEHNSPCFYQILVFPGVLLLRNVASDPSSGMLL